MSPRATRPLPSAPVVAVVGATGLVGRVLLDVLAGRGFPLDELRPLADASAGAALDFGGERLTVGRATPAALEGVDLVFFAATGELSRTLAPAALEHGARVVDKSATFRRDPDVPLVVPAVNGHELGDATALVACPNCTTIALVHVLEPLRRAAGLARVVVTTLQAASGAGRAGLEELEAGERALAAGRDEPPARVFPASLARNALPLCDTLDAQGVAAEEAKLVYETRRLLGAPRLPLDATTTRVPVAVGHAASVLVETERPLSVADARAALAAFPAVRVTDLPTPRAVAGTDEVLVGRLRAAPGSRPGYGLLLWLVADNLRRGAATNAVEIAERLLGAAD